MPTHRTIFRGALLALSLSLIPLAAHAQATNPAAVAKAQSLYNEAVAAMKSKDYAGACPKLEQATELIPQAIGAREALADCYQGAGKLASAWSQYTVVDSLARNAGQEKRAKAAASKAADLEPKLAKMTIEVPETVAGLSDVTITLDSQVLNRALWGTAVPVDAGKHAVEVKAPGRDKWAQEFTVADGVRERVKVPVLEVSAEAQPLAGTLARGVEPAPPVALRTWQRPLGFAAMGLGVVSFGASGVLAGLAAAKNGESKADGRCDAGNLCNDTGHALRQEALGLAHGATATVVIGGVLAAGGLVLVLTAPAKEKAPVQGKVAGVRWGIEVGPAGLGVRGTW
jgi:tetratricopeptide (TPR) repeat protein